MEGKRKGMEREEKGVLRLVSEYYISQVTQFFRYEDNNVNIIRARATCKNKDNKTVGTQ